MTLSKFFKKDSRRSSEILFVLSLFCVFAISALALVNIGATVYQNIVKETDNNFDMRTSLSYVATKVRQCDQQNAVSVEPLSGQDALVLRETIDGDAYETWIYHYDGKLYELFTTAGAQFTPQEGTDLMEIKSFTIRQPQEGQLLLEAVNDQGVHEKLVLTLRSSSVGGGAK